MFISSWHHRRCTLLMLLSMVTSALLPIIITIARNAVIFGDRNNSSITLYFSPFSFSLQLFVIFLIFANQSVSFINISFTLMIMMIRSDRIKRKLKISCSGRTIRDVGQRKARIK
jgi:hypothetical protein